MRAINELIETSRRFGKSSRLYSVSRLFALLKRKILREARYDTRHFLVDNRLDLVGGGCRTKKERRGRETRGRESP